MGEQVIWKANSSRHDWTDAGLLQAALESACRIPIVGPVQWLKTDAGKKSVSIPAGPDLADALLKAAPRRGDTIEFSAGGSDPAPWEVFWNVYPYLRDFSIVQGINTFWLSFDRDQVADTHQTGKLLDAFTSLHAPTNTEYAVIHPYDHWSDFAEAHYNIPITITPMFQGIFWANYLGPGHLDEFDLEKLDELAVFRAEWVGKQGQFMILAAELADADSSECEQEMLRLTAAYRAALRHESKWRA